MKALVLEDAGRFAYTDVPEPEMGPEDVLIAVQACGICGSDVHGMDGSTGRRRPPIIMGHEASGVIVDTGANVNGWKKGARVTFDSTIYCGACAFCQSGHANLCDNRRVLGVSCEDYRCHGAFADFVAVPQHILYALPDTVSFERAALVEPVSIAFHAVNRTPMKLNDSAVVIGTGMIGLLVVQALRLAGCGTIIAVDMDDERLLLAKKLGADITLRADGDDLVNRVQNLTGGLGADCVFEAVGIAPTVALGASCVRKGGSVTLVGNLAPQVEFPLQAIVTREISLYGSCASCGEYPACLDMIGRRAIDVDPLISAVAPLSEGAAWFDRLYAKEPGLLKVVLRPEDASA